MKTFLISFLFAACAFASAAGAAALIISTHGDDLKFDKASMNAKAGEKVKVTFKNSASKNSGLQHNWVLVKQGQADAVAQAAMAAGADHGWLGDSPDIIAHTKLVNPGEKETVEFTAPAEAGDYPYFCSFPGHSTTMKGLLHVKK